MKTKLIAFCLGVIFGYLAIKFFFGSVLGYTNIESGINDKRKYKLRDSGVLDNIANCRAKYLFDNNLWTHDGHKICFNKYKVYTYGEILAKDFLVDSDIITAWINSPTHKLVMLGRWKKIGSSKYGNIVVVTFSN